MSYSVTLTIDTGGKYPASIAEIGVSGRGYHVVWGFGLGFDANELRDKKASEMLPAIAAAVNKLHDPAFREEVENLGDPYFEVAIQCLERLREECFKHPKTTITVW